MSGEAPSGNINILNLTKVKAFIWCLQAFPVCWLVSAKGYLSPLARLTAELQPAVLYGSRRMKLMGGVV